VSGKPDASPRLLSTQVVTSMPASSKVHDLTCCGQSRACDCVRFGRNMRELAEKTWRRGWESNPRIKVLQTLYQQL